MCTMKTLLTPEKTQKIFCSDFYSGIFYLFIYFSDLHQCDDAASWSINKNAFQLSLTFATSASRKRHCHLDIDFVGLTKRNRRKVQNKSPIISEVKKLFTRENRTINLTLAPSLRDASVHRVWRCNSRFWRLTKQRTNSCILAQTATDK